MPMPALRPGNRFRSRACVGSALAFALSLSPYAAGATVSGEDPVSADPVSAAVWPVDPHPVVAAFDPPGCDFCSGHRGVDLGIVPSRPVRSALPGTVTYAGDLAGRGVVVVDDGTRRVTYEPVTASLPKGAQVAAGDLLGHVALVGSHCYPDACLHLGLIDDATEDYLDPLTLFAASAQVRLLPLWADESIWSDLGLAPFL